MTENIDELKAQVRKEAIKNKIEKEFENTIIKIRDINVAYNFIQITFDNEETHARNSYTSARSVDELIDRIKRLNNID